MTIYSYKISKKIIYNISQWERDWNRIFKAYLLLCEHLKEFLHLVPQAWCRGTSSVVSWYPEQDAVVPRSTRPVKTQNTDSLTYTIFLRAYYAMKFRPFPLPL